MVERAAWPAIHRGRSAGCGQQYRHRGGCARAARWLHAAGGHRGQCDRRIALRQAQFQFYPRHRPGHGHQSRRFCHGGQSVISRKDGARLHRLRQGQPGEDQYGDERHWHRAPDRRRAVQDDGRHRDDAGTVSRRRARDLRCHWRRGTGLFQSASRADRANQGG